MKNITIMKITIQKYMMLLKIKQLTKNTYTNIAEAQ